MLSLVFAILILLYPHKVAGIAVAVLGAIWDVAVTIGRTLKVPGTHDKAAMLLPWLGFLLPRNMLTPQKHESKEIN